jgi:hypothetical protein
VTCTFIREGSSKSGFPLASLVLAGILIHEHRPSLAMPDLLPISSSPRHAGTCAGDVLTAWFWWERSCGCADPPIQHRLSLSILILYAPYSRGTLFVCALISHLFPAELMAVFTICWAAPSPSLDVFQTHIVGSYYLSSHLLGVRSSLASSGWEIASTSYRSGQVAALAQVSAWMRRHGRRRLGRSAFHSKGQWS